MQSPQEFAPEDPSLRVLMAHYQSGSAEAFHRLHDMLAPDLHAYLTKLCRDSTRADDLLQETFLQIHRARVAHTPGEAVRPWVFAIAKRVFLMHRRSSGRRQRYEQAASESGDGTFVAAAQAERLDARRQVESALRRVPPGGRRPFVLHHLLGLSFKEIAARMGINAGAAKIRSSRAATLMRRLLREHRND